MTDAYGQELDKGDLVVIITGRSRSGFRDRLARIIKIDKTIHWIERDRKASGGITMIKVPSTNYTLPYEEEIDEFFTKWVKTHKEFR